MKSIKPIIHQDVTSLGLAAAKRVAQKIESVLEEKKSLRLILATGTSQFSFLEALQLNTIDWSRITVFHLDEYVGLSNQHPASFRNYLHERILKHVAPQAIFYLNADDPSLETVCETYTQALKAAPIDIACIGIGENGHLAFNDPPVAQFDDPHWVKRVSLDPHCRQQQLDEGWFSTLDEVPKEAVTLTLPAIMACDYISCVVPELRKAKAVYDALHGPLTTGCPASILRAHPQVDLHLDLESASLLTP
ncbi:MAG: glucosamine-6-phosphate deaminase [Flavobacteriaceae bacterium]